MIDVPVVWLSFHNTPDKDTIPRGYWDQAMLEDAFAGRLGSMSPLRFKHFVIHCEPDADDGLWPIADGVIVVVGARHHADRVSDINARLANYAWAVCILTGDEEGVFPYLDLDSHVVVMRQTPKIIDGQPLPADEWWFGDGYTPGFRDVLASDYGRRQYDAKVADFCFAGQVTHARRRQCVEALKAAKKYDGRLGLIHESPGFTQGLLPEAYAIVMAGAKIAPCPSGPVSVDTFRLFEALEAGCVPLADGRSPLHTQFSYWSLVLGDVPFPIVDDWRLAPKMIADVLADWPAVGNRCFAWWLRYKREFSEGIIDATLQAAAKAGRPMTWPLDLDRAITVVVPTSPVRSHPDTAIIEETLASIRERLPHAEIRVVFDGVRPEQEHLRERYEEYQRRLLWKMNHEWHDVIPYRLDEHCHQARATKIALRDAETPCVLFVEHDTPLVGDIPFGALVQAVMTGEANVVRFHHESSVLEPHQWLMVHDTPRPIGAAGVPVLGTMQWSQRPHLASMPFYQQMLDEYFGEQSRTMIEDTMHGVLDYFWRHEGVGAWKRWKTYLYAPDGDMKRSTHLDARQGEPMFDMVFEYDGEVPPGAPHPTSRR